MNQWLQAYAMGLEGRARLNEDTSEIHHDREARLAAAARASAYRTALLDLHRGWPFMCLACLSNPEIPGSMVGLCYGCDDERSQKAKVSK